MGQIDRRVAAWLCAGLVVLWLGSLTLSADDSPNHTNLIPFQEKRDALSCIATDCWHARESARFLAVDVVGNVVVFTPLGAALALATTPRSDGAVENRRARWRRWWGILFFGALLSLGIEVAQLLIPSRATDIDDLILNTLGTGMGAGIVMAARLLRHRV